MKKNLAFHLPVSLCIRRVREKDRERERERERERKARQGYKRELSKELQLLLDASHFVLSFLFCNAMFAFRLVSDITMCTQDFLSLSFSLYVSQPYFTNRLSCFVV